MIISREERKLGRLKMNSSQRGTNLCGADVRPTDEISLARGVGGEQRV